MLAYYVEWHMRRALAPLLFDDDDPTARPGPPGPRPSHPSRRAASVPRTAFPSTSFQTLLADLATLTRNRVQPTAEGAAAADVLTRPHPHSRPKPSASSASAHER